MHILGYDMPRLHAALNDFPAALLVVAVLFDLGAWITKRDSLKTAALWTLWAGVIGGWAAVIAGELAEDVIEHGEAIHELMEKHETLALVTMGVFTVVLGVQLLRRARLTALEQNVLRGLSVVGLVLVVWTGRVGGQMMFEHAAGIPAATMRVEMEDREHSHEHHEGAAAAVDDTGHAHAPGTPRHRH